MKHVFGPVPSRRLGQSLGVDPIPLKTCNWNCVYCQLGRSRPLSNRRQDYYPQQEILAQVSEALERHKAEQIDWITFVGSGETTLCASLGDLIRQVKQLTLLPVAVITNGSLLYLPEVRQDLCAADAVLPTLDAGHEALFRKINRPHPATSFSRLVEGLRDFRSDFAGRLWVEVMLLHALNDSEEALHEIAGLLEEIHPNEVHIVLPTRPPVESWVQPADEQGIRRARALLGKNARLIDPAKGTFNLANDEDLIEAITGIITRHPMRESELVETLSRFTPRDILETLNALNGSGKAQIVDRFGVRFWCASPSVFPPQEIDVDR